jgi:hypothetical protein
MGTLKFELSIKDLETLLNGEGNEVGLQIKNCIVQEFTKRYLKSLVTEVSSEMITKSIRVEVDSFIKNEFIKDEKMSFKTELVDRVKDLIKKDIEVARKDTLDTCFSTARNDMKTGISGANAEYREALKTGISNIESYLKRDINNIIDERINLFFKNKFAVSNETTKG